MVIRGYSLALVLVSASSSVAEARRQAGCPVDSQVSLDYMKLEGDGWRTDCGADTAGRLIFAASRPPQEKEPIRIVLVIVGADGRMRRAEYSIDASEPAVHEVMYAADEWFVNVDPNALGRDDVVRVSVVGRFGADFWFGQEIVSFFQMGPKETNLLWTGRGDRGEVQYDSCVIKELASFRLTKDGKLERSIKGQRSFRNAGIPDKMAAELGKACIAPRPRREVFPLRPARQ